MTMAKQSKNPEDKAARKPRAAKETQQQRRAVSSGAETEQAPAVKPIPKTFAEFDACFTRYEKKNEKGVPYTKDAYRAEPVPGFVVDIYKAMNWKTGLAEKTYWLDVVHAKVRLYADEFLSLSSAKKAAYDTYVRIINFITNG